MTTSFDDVPITASGERLLRTTTDDEFAFYLNWLADYLYRPESLGCGEVLDEDDARGLLIGIESEIAGKVWTAPYDDYPPPEKIPASGAKHADILHRRQMADILSRVPDLDTRVRLLHRFYTELTRDLYK